MGSPRVFSYEIPTVWSAGISQARARLRPLTQPDLGPSARRAGTRYLSALILPGGRVAHFRGPKPVDCPKSEP